MTTRPVRLPRALLAGALLLLATAAPAAAARTVRVPQDARDLQTAIARVSDRGLVVIAPGTYAAPARAFRVAGRKTFTVRAAVPGAVVLDGGGARQILRIEGSGAARRPRVTFQGITFRRGAAALHGGAVFLRQAEAVFRNCRFEDNSAVEQGGAVLALDARLVLDRVTLVRNRALGASGAGGAVAARRSLVTVRRSRFTDNRAGWVGGAVYAYGDWRAPAGVPTTLVDVSDTDFAGNAAERIACCPPAATVGGAIHGEDQTTVRLVGSRLTGNRAETGAGLSLYRAHAEIRDSVFRGNAPLPGGGAGAAVLLLSADHADASTGGGAIDRPPASLIAERTLFQGGGAGGTLPPAGGCVTAAGDVASLRGTGVPRRGTPADHRAPVVLRGVVFAHCAGSGGGALAGSLVELEVRDALFLASRADAEGGAVSLLAESVARFHGVTFAGNAAGSSGGALRAAGSHLEVRGGAFLDNEVAGGATPSRSRGAALFTAPSAIGGRPSGATGVVEGVLFAGGRGLPLYELDDRTAPGNAMRYDRNRFHGSGFGPVVFFSGVAGERTVAALNALVLSRADGSVVRKSHAANEALLAPPAHGALLASPSRALVLGPEGSIEPAWLGYAWTGGSASLGGEALPARHGLRAAPEDGERTLAVDGAPRASVRVGPEG